MRAIYTLALALVVSKNCWAQELLGLWKGSYTYTEPFSSFTGRPSPIRIHFYLNDQKDGYVVFSFTKITHNVTTGWIDTCKMAYQKLSEDSIRLEEVQLISRRMFAHNGFQQMRLNIIRKQKRQLLVGAWKSAPGGG